VRPSLVKDGIHDWLGPDAPGVGGPRSEFRLTDDERKLRDLAYPLIEPPYDRNKWYSVLGEYGHRPLPGREGAPYDRTKYWKKLDVEYRRSEASSYARLNTDIRNDVERIEPFYAIAFRVIDLDRKRIQSLAHVSELSPAEHRNAIGRTKENAAIVRWVCRSLDERVAAYRFALERLVIEVPSGAAAEAERSLTLLKTRITQYCRLAPAHVRRDIAVTRQPVPLPTGPVSK
jgi:hypothetical protein